MMLPRGSQSREYFDDRRDSYSDISQRFCRPWTGESDIYPRGGFKVRQVVAFDGSLRYSNRLCALFFLADLKIYLTRGF